MKIYLFLILAILFVHCAENTDSYDTISNTTVSITIDGQANESAWSNTEWRPIDQLWIGEDYSERDFQGKYKVLWDENHIYVLASILDDTLMDIHMDGLDRYWDDDCLEIFVDEDASGGDHQYNYNAFAYHIGLDGSVADIGVDSLPHYYDHCTSRRVTNGQESIWEVAIDLYDDTFTLGGYNQSVSLMKGKKIGFAIAYCDNDHSEERENFIGSTYVAGEDKNRGWIDAGIFGKYVLSEK